MNTAASTTGERPEALGPQGAYVARLIDAVRWLTADEAESIAAAWDDAGVAAWDAAWYAAREAVQDADRVDAWDAAWEAVWDATARDAAQDAAWYTARGAAQDAAQALVVADLITPEHLDALTAPVMEVPALASIITEAHVYCAPVPGSPVEYAAHVDDGELVEALEVIADLGVVAEGLHAMNRFRAGVALIGDTRSALARVVRAVCKDARQKGRSLPHEWPTAGDGVTLPWLADQVTSCLTDTSVNSHPHHAALVHAAAVADQLGTTLADLTREG